MHFERLYLLCNGCNGRYYLSTGHLRLTCLIRSSGSYLLVCIPLSVPVQLLVTATFSCSGPNLCPLVSFPFILCSVHQEHVDPVFRFAGVGVTCSLHCFHPESRHQSFSPECPSGLLAGLLCPCSVLALSFLWPCSVFAIHCYDLVLTLLCLALTLLWPCSVSDVILPCPSLTLLWHCSDIALSYLALTLLCPCSDLAPFYTPSVHAQCSWRVHPLIEASVVPPTPQKCFVPASFPGLSGLPAEMLHTCLHCQLLHDASGFVLEPPCPPPPCPALLFSKLITIIYHLSVYHLSIYHLCICPSTVQDLKESDTTERLNWTGPLCLSVIYLSFMLLLSPVLEYICPKNSLLYPTKGWISRACNCLGHLGTQHMFADCLLNQKLFLDYIRYQV